MAALALGASWSNPTIGERSSVLGALDDHHQPSHYGGRSERDPARLRWRGSLADTSGIQAKYLDQLFNGQNGDARYVHVPASTEFYIFPTVTIRAAHRTIDNQASSKDETQGWRARRWPRTLSGSYATRASDAQNSNNQQTK